MGDLILIVLVSAALLGGALYFGQKRADSLIAEGKMIKRDMDFWNFAEIFTLSSVDYKKLRSEINDMDFSEFKITSYPDNGGKSEILFKSGYEWNARILYLGESEGRNKFRFEFTTWNTYNGLPMRSDTMNMMETKIEKMFLKLDPNTVVETVENKIETKHKLF